MDSSGFLYWVLAAPNSLVKNMAQDVQAITQYLEFQNFETIEQDRCTQIAIAFLVDCVRLHPESILKGGHVNKPPVGPVEYAFRNSCKEREIPELKKRGHVKRALEEGFRALKVWENIKVTNVKGWTYQVLILS